MIHYIIAVDPKTGNEWVMPKTAETITELIGVVEEYRAKDDRFQYRIDTATPSVANRVRFTVSELFPPVQGGKIPSSNCVECGAYVVMTWQVTHAGWHNKVADL